MSFPIRILSSALLLILLPACGSPPRRPASLDEIHLNGDCGIKGQVIKETPDALFVDIGYTVITVPRKEIVAVTGAGGKGRNGTG